MFNSIAFLTVFLQFYSVFCFDVVADNSQMTIETSEIINLKIKARGLFWQGWRVSDIAKELCVSKPTLYSWVKRENWKNTEPRLRASICADDRLSQLYFRENKTEKDYKEMRHLENALLKIKKTGQREAGKAETTGKQRGGRTRTSTVKNIFTDEQIAKLDALFKHTMFGYQKKWYEAGLKHDARIIIKSRQIGATHYFSFEALLDAIHTGRNQIFLSASEKQALQFKRFMQGFAREVGVELEGEVITLWNGAELHFLGTNSKTAQSRTGNLYVDEFAWIAKFKELKDLAAGMASQIGYRETYISTPFAKDSEAYDFFSGKEFNTGRPKKEQIKLDISHKALSGGVLCGDRHWRQIVNIVDAVNQGCNLFDIDDLRFKKSPEVFDLLYMCNWMDKGDSVFPLHLLQPCQVDIWSEWADKLGIFKPHAPRPAGDLGVWVSYDPNDGGDSAGVAVILPPQYEGDKFRLLEAQQFMGDNFNEQAAFLEALTEKYNVEKMVIDATGLGSGVYQLVLEFFPAAIGLTYSAELKVEWVLKTKRILAERMFEYDLGERDFVLSMLGIRRNVTKSGRNITYQSVRTKESSHSDIGWATVQLLGQTEWNGATEECTSSMEVIG